MIKKILSILLIVSMVFSYVTVANAKSAETFAIEDKIEILKALDMINEEYDELTIDNSKTLTKSEYAFFAANAFAKGRTSDALYFHDLPRENWACKYVSVLVEEGLISVNTEKYFYPEEEMSIESAYEISLRALGFSSVMDGQNTLSLAQNVGITKGVQVTYGLNFQNAVLIVYNTLFSKSMTIGGNSFVQSEKTFIQNKYSIMFEEGVLECVDGVSITTDRGNGYTYISGTEFEPSDLNLYDLLGCEIVYIYQYDEYKDVRNLLWVKKAKDNDKELQLMYVENDISFDTATYKLTYYDGKRYRHLQLNTDIDVVYNNEYVVSGVEEILTNEFYSLKLVERDNEFKCLIVRKYDNYNVGGIDINKQCIYDKTSNNVLDLYSADKIIIKNVAGTQMSFEDIKIDDVLSVYKSISGDIIEVVVSDNTVSGTVTSITTDDWDYQCFTINGNTYRMAKPNEIENIFIKSDIVLYLDANGYISLIKGVGELDTIAYIIGTKYDDSKDRIIVRLYDKSGKIQKYECADRLKINKKKTYTYKNMDEAYTKLSDYGHGLVTYKKNAEGFITNIQLVTNDGSSDLRLRASKASLRYTSTGRLGQKMCLDNNTIIFGVPSNINNATAEDFKITTKAGLYADLSYTVESYAISEDVGYEQILLVYDNNWNYKHGNTIGILVSGTYKTLNEYGDPVDCIKGWQGTQAVEKLCHEDFSVDSKDIEKGDYITFEENSQGEILSATVQYDISAERRPKAKDMHAIEALTSGYVNDVNGNVATLGIESGADFDMAFDFAAGGVLIYEVDSNTATVGSIRDLIPYEVAGSRCDFMLVHMRYSKQLVYIIYR